MREISDHLAKAAAHPGNWLLVGIRALGADLRRNHRATISPGFRPPPGDLAVDLQPDSPILPDGVCALVGRARGSIGAHGDSPPTHRRPRGQDRAVAAL